MASMVTTQTFKLCIIVCLFSFDCYGDPATLAPTFKIDLDTPAIERWSEVMQSFDKDDILQTINHVFSSVLPSRLQPVITSLASELLYIIPQPYRDEIVGISKALDIKLGDAVLMNIVYDLTAYKGLGFKACTSIVACDSNGTIFHGRNLDYFAPADLRKLTIQVEFMKNDKVHFKATTYAGYVGIVTGYRPNLFSITGDERDEGSLVSNILSLLGGNSFTFFMEREVLNKAQNYSEALQLLTSSPTIAPVYFILAGVNRNEGAIITKSAGGLVNVTKLGENSLFPSWFLVETNYDPWVQVPKSDDRRGAAIRSLVSIGQANITLQHIQEVLSAVPVFNRDTTYTTVMQTSSSHYSTIIRYDAPP